MIENIIRKAIAKGASDVHITENSSIVYRINGNIIFDRDTDIISSDNINEICKVLVKEVHYEKFMTTGSYDGGIEICNRRLRIHIFRASDHTAIALRLLSDVIPTLREIGFGQQVKDILKVRDGLVLVTGPTGSGKTTTLAAMINEINSTQDKNIRTIEDPIEFIHKNKMCFITQSEIGIDINSFSSATRAVLREDPDIILIGEMRDFETIDNAIVASETGHLVFGTLHTKSAAESITRLIDSYPPIQQQQIRTTISNTLRCIISQRLLPCIGGGRVLAAEIMVVNSGIRNIIREGLPINMINDQMQTNRESGCQTMYQVLTRLVKENKISVTDAEMYVDNKTTFKEFISKM